MAEGFTGLWPKKVKVILYDAYSNVKIGEHKIAGQLLPDSFNKPVVIEIDKKLWRIIEVAILREESYLFGTRIKLLVTEAQLYQFQDRYETPSLPVNLPLGEDIEDDNKAKMFSIAKNNYRQLEFFPATMIEEVQKNLLKIEKIIAPEEKINNLLGFKEVHLREKIFDFNLEIDFLSFVDVIKPVEIRPLVLNEQLIPGGFSLQTSNYIYYGIRDGNLIRELSITTFESADDEFTTIVSLHGLILVDWCNACVFMNMPDDAPEAEILKI